MIAGFLIFGAIGAAWIWSLAWVASRQPVKKAETKSDKPPTLFDLFMNDFPTMLRASLDEDAFTVKFNDEAVVSVKSRVYMDFEAKTKFVGFYVRSPVPPSADLSSNKTFAACLSMLRDDAINRTIRDMSQRALVMGGNVTEMTRMKDLTFSGRVFIYHEEFLSITQKADMVRAYKERHLDVSFRGPDYLASQLTDWYHQHGAKGAP